MRRNRGFTLPEIIVAVSFFLILLSLVTLNLLGARGQIARGANIDVLVADLKEQQAKAMAGEGTAPIDYGIFLEENRYTLFTGSVYNPNANSNFVVNLDPTVTLTNITLPNSVIVFTKGSGEVSGYNPSQDSFLVNVSTNPSGKTVTVNKFGSVNIQ